MTNKYLYIDILDNGRISVNTEDGVFSSIAIVDSEEDFYKYCNEKAEMWLTSNLGNFEGWTDEDRKVVADKWLKAKALHEGKYPHYFNIGNIHDIFRQQVSEIAKSMGIKNYILEINE